MSNPSAFSARPPTTDVRLHETMGGGGILSDVTRERNMTTNSRAADLGASSAAGLTAKSGLLLSSTSASPSASAFSTGASAFSLSHYRHDSIDVKAEVDRMYQSILRTLEASATEPHHSSGRPQHSPLDVNFAASSSSSPSATATAFASASGGGSRAYATPKHQRPHTAAASSPASHSYINATTDSRVAAMQALLRQSAARPFGVSSASTSGLYRSNTFGSGRKGMSDPITKIDTPGPGSYGAEGAGRRAQSAAGGGRAPSPHVRARSADRGVSFGKSDRPPLVLSDREVNKSRRDAVRPPGPGDYIAPSTFASSRPTSTKGSFSKADRDAGKAKPIAPGPGTYAIVDQKESADKLSGKSPAFASTTPRLPPVRSEAPGPGAYLAASAPTAAQPQGFSFGKAPLATLAPPAEVTPGPGDYYIETEDPNRHMRGVIPSAGRDDSAWGGKKLAGDTPGPGAYTIRAEERDGVSMKFRYKERVEEAPGPGAYCPPQDAQQRQGPSWSFVGKPQERPIEVTPGPGQYSDVATTNDEAKGVSIGGARREMPSDAAARENFPGPGFYETATSALSTVGPTSFGNARRTNEFEATANKNEAPGPGTYDPHAAAALVEKRAPVPSLGGNAERFASDGPEGSAPGPGHYLVTYDAQTIVGGAIAQAPRDAGGWAANETATGALGPGAYESTVTFNSGRAVSIGLPIAGPAPDTNPLVGPGAYDAAAAAASILPAAPAIGMGKEGRFGVPPKVPEVPGPGAYDTVDPDTWLYEKAPAASFGNAPRMPAEAAPTVGPGAYMYEHNDAIGTAAVGGAIDGAARFQADEAERLRRGEVPGPGAYDVPSNGIDTQKTVTIGGTGHETMASSADVPGPGAYHTNATTLSGRGVSIGKSAQREAPKPNDAPGPGTYDASRSAVDPHIPGPMINGRPAERSETDGVGPGAYDVTYSHLPTAPAVSLEYGPRRFDIVSGKDVPGPGYYDPHGLLAAAQEAGVGLLSSGAPRFADPNPSTTPGPGTYDTAAYHAAMEAQGGITISGHVGGNTQTVVPGPGAYDPRFPEKGGFTIHAYDRARAAAPSGADVPGPGQYTLPSTNSAKAASFGIGHRPDIHPPESEGPGPGRYDPYSAMKHLHQSSPAYSFSAAAKYGIPDSRSLYPGPGAYIPVFEGNPSQGPSYTFGREERPTLHPVLSDAPGPGIYNTDMPSAAPAYSFPTANRAPADPISEVPGPGTYSTALPPSGPFITFGGEKGHDVVRPGAADVPGPGAYNITRTGVLAGDENAPAYSFGSAAKLKEEAPRDQPGPGHYNPMLYAEGPFYSIAGKYPNNLEPRPDGPGPGAYEIGSTLETNAGVSVPQAIRFPAQPTDDTPGPGTYLPISGQRDGPAIGFSSAPRMPADPTADVPGPGMYDQTLPPQGPWHSIAGKYSDGPQANDGPGPGAYNSELPADSRGAVMLGAPRFERDANSDAPGPGMYSLAAQWNDGKSAVFPTADKPADRELREAAQVPGPGQYSTALAPNGPFYSMLGKQSEAPSGAAHVPGPGAYNVAQLEKGPSAFIGNAPRELTDATDSFPGPGAYALPSALSPMGPTFGVAQRMPNAPANDVPGPGLYDAGGVGMFDGPKYSFPLAANRPGATNDVPGPGMYNAGPGKDATMPQDSVYSFARGQRMAGDKISPDNGPGAYNVGDAPHAGPSWSFGQAAPYGRGGAAVADNPGPGAYSPANLWNKDGPAIQGKWRDSSAPAGPGPGAYRTHDFDPYARDMATVIDFSKGGERIVNAPIKTVTSAGPGAYYKVEHYQGTKQFRFLERYPEPYAEPTPGPPDYHRPNVENPFYDPLAR